MGILLPPVSQVTNTRINHTQHHRNRSLDSALQRIPEVSNLYTLYYFLAIVSAKHSHNARHPLTTFLELGTPELGKFSYFTHINTYAYMYVYSI